MARPSSSQVLFGSDVGWSNKDWTSSDDRVRGGKSQSHLECRSADAVFWGILDIETLGGAGFASQRTTGEQRCFDLSSFDGIELTIDITESDRKQYTFILKDELLPRNPTDGREQSTLSWEYDFEVSTSCVNRQGGSQFGTVFIPWNGFTATYRGKKQEDTRNLDLKGIKRMSIMMRSFFGAQAGHFRLSIVSIAAIHKQEAVTKPTAATDDPEPLANDDASSHTDSTGGLCKQNNAELNSKSLSLWQWLFGRCWKL